VGLGSCGAGGCVGGGTMTMVSRETDGALYAEPLFGGGGWER